MCASATNVLTTYFDRSSATKKETQRKGRSSQMTQVKEAKPSHVRQDMPFKKTARSRKPSQEVDTREPVMLAQHMLDLDMGVWSMHSSQVRPGTHVK